MCFPEKPVCIRSSHGEEPKQTKLTLTDSTLYRTLEDDRRFYPLDKMHWY